MNVKSLLPLLLVAPLLYGAEDFAVEATRPFDEEVMKQYRCGVMSAGMDSTLTSFLKNDISDANGESGSEWKIMLAGKYSSSGMPQEITVGATEVFVRDLTSTEQLSVEYYGLRVEPSTGTLRVRHIFPLAIKGKWVCFNSFVLLSVVKKGGT